MNIRKSILTICLLGLTTSAYQPNAHADLLNSGNIAIGTTLLCGTSLLALYPVYKKLTQWEKELSVIQEGSGLASAEEAERIISLEKKINKYTKIKQGLILLAGGSGACAATSTIWYFMHKDQNLKQQQPEQKVQKQLDTQEQREQLLLQELLEKRENEVEPLSSSDLDNLITLLDNQIYRQEQGAQPELLRQLRLERPETRLRDRRAHRKQQLLEKRESGAEPLSISDREELVRLLEERGQTELLGQLKFEAATARLLEARNLEARQMERAKARGVEQTKVEHEKQWDEKQQLDDLRFKQRHANSALQAHRELDRKYHSHNAEEKQRELERLDQLYEDMQESTKQAQREREELERERFHTDILERKRLVIKRGRLERELERARLDQ